MKALTELKKECFNRVAGSFCFCCGDNKPRKLLLHHLSYNEKSVTYNKFPNTDDGRLKYYSCLLDEIKQQPDNFLVLCINCHDIIERLLKMEWIDAFNLCNENEYGMYEKAWKMSYDKRDKSNLLQDAVEILDKLFPKRTELVDFFK